MRISDWSSDVCSSDLAASSGDGGYLEPAFYPDVSGSYDAVFGGPPTDPVALMHYRRLSPSLRADKVCGAVLPQVAAPLVPSRSEEHTSELQSLMRTSYAVFCLKNNKPNRHEHAIYETSNTHTTHTQENK